MSRQRERERSGEKTETKSAANRVNRNDLRVGRDAPIDSDKSISVNCVRRFRSEVLGNGKRAQFVRSRVFPPFRTSFILPDDNEPRLVETDSLFPDF